MIELAAAIAPAEWQRGYADRALARRLAAGRVPDSIRLRRRRGGQGRDSLFLLRDDPDRILDSIASTPVDVWNDLGIDPNTLRRTVTTILDPESRPPHGRVEDVMRVAALGEFVVAVRADLPGSRPTRSSR